MNKKVLAMAVLASLSLTPAYAKDTTQELVQAVGNHVDEDGHIDGQSVGNQMVNQGIASGLSKALLYLSTEKSPTKAVEKSPT